jgi:hypothetical protein
MKWIKTQCRPLATKIFNATNQGRLAMRKGEALTAPQIIGAETWSTLDEDEQCFAFCFVSSAVEINLLGLARAGQDSRKNWLYQLS